MQPEPENRSSPAVAVVFMALITLWSGGLAWGFSWAAATGADRMGPGRTAAFWLVAAFLGLLAGRTGYELVRRLLRR